MDSKALQSLLAALIERWENEVVEFKRAGDGYSTDDIGKYFSALANEANLRNHDRAWLVFGVDNRSRKAVGSDYRPEPERLHGLKMQISAGTEPAVTLRNIHELLLAEGRVLLFEIPAAPLGMPIAWKGHYYARAGESLTHLGLDKLDEIRRLEDILALDRVQKRLPLDAAMVQHLRQAGLIAGRKPNLHVSANVAKAAASKADYIRTRGFDDAYYKEMILVFLENFGSASRQKIDQLLDGKLSDALEEEHKQHKISNLLSHLRRAKRIRNTGSRNAPVWVLAE